MENKAVVDDCCTASVHGPECKIFRPNEFVAH